MQDRIVKYFEKEEWFPLSETPFSSLEEAQSQFPRLSKGWYELSRLESSVRFEFLRDYWINAFSYSPQLYAFIDRFFAAIEEIAMVATKKAIYLTYSLKKGETFFLGGPPLIDEEIANLKEMVDFPLPQDFLQFFRIHDGFFKAGDTGVLSSGVLVKEAQRFKNLNHPLKMGNSKISSERLLPFYCSFGLDVYQCFYRDWYPDGGVGNLLCSLVESTLTDYRTKEEGALAFPTFSEWLAFYLEDVEVR